MNDLCPLENHFSSTGNIAHLDDGRPDVDEAWEMLPRTEAASVVWTDEMAHAWSAAVPHMQSGAMAKARKVFEEAYDAEVRAARECKAAVRWTPSLGTDPAQREKVLLDALKKERLSVFHVKTLLPPGPLSLKARRILTHVRLKKIPETP